MSGHFAVTGHWNEEFDESKLGAWAQKLRSSLGQHKPSLGLVFLAPRFFSKASEILESLRVDAQVPLLAGCSSQALISGGDEIEENAGLVLGLYSLPGAELRAFHFTQQNLDEASGPEYWRNETRIAQEQTNGWLVFGDPFNLDCDSWLRQWNEAYAPAPVVGGLASGDLSARNTQLYLNGDVFDEGVIAISIAGEVGITSVISQGCTPIGETWTITHADQNLIYEIGNRPAYMVLAETFAQLPEEEQKKSRGNLFIGLVINEYLEEFGRGDFLVRNLLGGDPATGVIAVGAFPRTGQTIQFHRRDAAAANEDMLELLSRTHENLKEKTVYGGCLCSCNGRGSNLFGYPSHDAGMVQRRLGPVGLTGFFCNGEIGPVGARNFLHGYTASLALFVKQARTK